MTTPFLSSKAKTASVYNAIPNIADIRTPIIADTDVRERQNAQPSQRVGVFADIRTSPPLRGDALSAIPRRAEMRAALRAALGSLLLSRTALLGRIQ